MNDKERIEELLYHFRMMQKDFAEKCGILPETIADIKREKHGISKRVFGKIIKAFPEVNKEWLATGDGEMLIGDQKTGDISNSAVNINSKNGIAQYNSPDAIIEISLGYQRIIEKQQEQMDEMIKIIRTFNEKQ